MLTSLPNVATSSTDKCELNLKLVELLLDASEDLAGMPQHSEPSVSVTEPVYVHVQQVIKQTHVLHMRLQPRLSHTHKYSWMPHLSSPKCWQGGSVAEWLASWTRVQQARVQIAAEHCRVTVLGKLFTPFVHQAAKLVAALLRVAGVTGGLAESNQVYDSHHLQADCQEPGSALEPHDR